MPCCDYYMNKEREMEILDYNPTELLKEQVGYELSTADPDKDAEFIHKAWVYADPTHVEQTAAKLRYLPNVCIRKDGVPVSYILLHLYGKFCHQFTAPEHRGKGLSTICEKELMRRIIRFGLYPLKEVAHKLTEVNRWSKSSEFWSISKEDDGSESTLIYLSLGRKI
ncbi:hypothetical protein WR25_25226 [Diploscapter pachys]|uniref:Glycine N-acyltransferase-like protein n=1 Tax=Diploscapter pachys TaxID=2018661 RepID=A0A2A2KF22_9BILA|nr:hypothetical protein WR25_25226 [Diploscapter pachys]